MSFYDLATSLGEISEETSMSDIAYLPTQLGAVKKKLGDLSKLKPDWKIDVLENGDINRVCFEDAFSIDVPTMHWDNFLEIFDNCDISNGYMNLRSILNEAMEDELDNTTDELKPTLIRAFTNPPFDQVDEDIDKWKVRFNVESFKEQNTVISHNNKKANLLKLYSELTASYEGDLGNLEMLITAFRDKTPLSAFEVFKDYDYVYGARILSNHMGVSMLFEATVDFTFVISESIYIEDQDIVDDVEADSRNIKVVGNVIYPRGERFDTNFYRILNDIIEDYA